MCFHFFWSGTIALRLLYLPASTSGIRVDDIGKGRELFRTDQNQLRIVSSRLFLPVPHFRTRLGQCVVS